MKKNKKSPKFSKIKRIVKYSPMQRKKFYPKSPKKILKKVFESVSEVYEEAKSESDGGDYIDTMIMSSFQNRGKKIKGILALTKENLRTLDFKNKVICV